MVKSVEILVDTNPVLLTGGDEGTASVPLRVIVQVPTGGQTVYIGGSDVTTDAGFAVPTNTSSPVLEIVGAGLYGIVAATSQSVRVLTTSP